MFAQGSAGNSALLYKLGTALAKFYPSINIYMLLALPLSLWCEDRVERMLSIVNTSTFKCYYLALLGMRADREEEDERNEGAKRDILYTVETVSFIYMAHTYTKEENVFIEE